MEQQKFINHFVKWSYIMNITIKLYHWNTTSYARHKATDSFLTDLVAITDKFVEVFIGIYKIKPDITNITLDPLDKSYLTDDGIINLLKTSKEVLLTEVRIISDTQLLNIHDELIAAIDQTSYLFNLS